MKFVRTSTALEEMTSSDRILFCDQRSGEWCTGKGFATGIEVQELYETLIDPGSGVEVEKDTAAEFEKTVHTLSAYFITKGNYPYERRV